MASEPIQKHNGKLVAAGPVDWLETHVDSKLAVVVEFPNAEDAQNWYNDPDYAHVHQLRNEAGKTSVAILPAM